MKLIDADNIDTNDIPCMYGDMTKLDYVQCYIDEQPELTASQVLEYVSKYVGSIHKYEGTPVYTEPCEQNNKIYVVSIGEYSDKSNVYATTDKEAAELFVKKYNFNRTYGNARIETFENYIPTKLGYLDLYIYELVFDENKEYRSYYTTGTPLSEEIYFVNYSNYLKELIENGIALEISDHSYTVYILHSRDITSDFLSKEDKKKIETDLIKFSKDFLMKKLSELNNL